MSHRVPLSRKIALGFLITPVILIAVGIQAYRSTQEFSRSAGVVTQTYRILSRLNSAMENLASAESEARGYIISRDYRQFTYYRHAADEVAADLALLKTLTIDPRVLALVEELERRMQARLNRLNQTVTAGESAGIEAVMEMAGPGRELMERVRAAAGEIETLERRLLNERNRAARAQGEKTLLVITLGNVLATGIAVLGGVLLTRELGRRQALERQLAGVRELEQRRIGQDLHDGVCQQLTAISLLSRTVQQKLAARSAPEASALADITRQIHQALDQTRQIIRGVNPVTDEPLGLMHALRDLCQTVEKTSHVRCRFDCPEPVPLPDPAAAENLFRIAQEAVQNALRHAQASLIEISLHSNDECIHLTVRDNGRGLKSPPHRRGLGMSSMQYRADSIGAELDVGPCPEGGTMVTCTLPRSSFN
jgi:two-component system CheB/CheR fusion protein